MCKIILHNGKIYTNDPENPTVEAIGIVNGVIEVLGSFEKVRKAIPGGRIVDLEGRIALPGLVDSHIHLNSLGSLAASLDLTKCNSIEELKLMVRRESENRGKGSWIIGRGWDQERLYEKRPPNRWDLDEATPSNPVLLVRVCGHVASVNSLALRIAGVSRETPDPPGGIIERDSNGEPTGVLYENAIMLIKRVIPPPSTEQLETMLSKAIEEGLKYGITLFGFPSATSSDMRALMNLKSKGLLKARVGVMYDLEYLDHLLRLGIRGGFGDGKLYILGVKTFLDGSLGGRTAYLREEYSDRPGWRGKLLLSTDELKYIVRKAHVSSIIVAFHAIGDGALQTLLSSIDNNTSSIVRIEHASVSPPDIIEKMRETMPMAIVVQPHFVISDWWIKDRIGERARWAYPFKTFIESGLVVAGSSDAPVEPVNPWKGMWAATSRSGPERITVEDAIKMYTINGGIAMGLAGYGMLVKGGYGDIIVVDEDPFKVEPNKLTSIKVKMTIVGGRMVYSNY